MIAGLPGRIAAGLGDAWANLKAGLRFAVGLLVFGCANAWAVLWSWIGLLVLACAAWATGIDPFFEDDDGPDEPGPSL